MHNLDVPEVTLILKTKLKRRSQKNQVVQNQKYEEAAQLRDTEKKLLAEFRCSKKKWIRNQRRDTK